MKQKTILDAAIMQVMSEGHPEKSAQRIVQEMSYDRAMLYAEAYLNRRKAIVNRDETVQVETNKIISRRENKKSDLSLVEAVKADGILVPLLIRMKSSRTYEIIDGQYRLNAARYLKMETVPCIIVP